MFIVMSVVGDDCRRMHCRGKVMRQQSLTGEELFICSSCGAEYTEGGASLH